jgi:hypothetical protein
MIRGSKSDTGKSGVSGVGAYSEIADFWMSMTCPSIEARPAR